MRSAIIFLLFLSFLSCKQVEIVRIPLVQTLDAVTVDNQVSLKLKLIDFPSNNDASIGFVVSDSNFIYETIITIQKITIDQVYEINLKELQSTTGIEFQAFCDYNGKRYFGEKKSSKHINLSPIVEILEVSRLTSNSAKFKLSLSKLGSFPIKNLTFSYSNKENSDSLIFSNIYKDTVFECIIQKLKTGPTFSESEYEFVFKVLGKNGQISSSNPIKLDFSTLKLTTDTFTFISDSIATLAGSIVNLGNLPIKEYGFVYSSNNPLPNYNDEKISLKSLAKLGAFFADIKLSSNGNDLYFRSYGSDGEGVYYGKTMKLVK